MALGGPKQSLTPPLDFQDGKPEPLTVGSVQGPDPNDQVVPCLTLYLRGAKGILPISF